jgi:hypothetical protein
MKGIKMKLNTETLEQFASECNLLLSDNLIDFANKVSQVVAYEIKQKKPKTKKETLPDNWQGNGKFKILDKTTNTYFITDFENACIHKGITPKQAFTVKRDIRDREKDFKGRDMLRMVANNDIKGYVYHWLRDNNLVTNIKESEY